MTKRVGGRLGKSGAVRTELTGALAGLGLGLAGEVTSPLRATISSSRRRGFQTSLFKYSQF